MIRGTGARTGPAWVQRGRGRAAGRFLLALLCATGLSGCALLFAMPAQMAKDHRDKATRTGAGGLDAIAPGTTIMMRPRHHEPETVRFDGYLVGDSVRAAPADTGAAVAVFHRGPRRWELPAAEIDWVQIPSSRWSVYNWFFVGLAIDAGVLYLLIRSFAGYGGVGA